MDLGLKEKVILVTGASRGIGKAIAAAFAAEGSSVILTARNQQDLEQTAQEIQLHSGHALAIAADVTNAGEVQHLVQQTIAHGGTIHVLVNNVGGADGFAPFEELPDGAWVDAFQRNVLSTVRLIRVVLPAMKQQRWGRVINISSEAGTQPDPFLPHYGAAKAAVTNLTKSVSRTYAGDGIWRIPSRQTGPGRHWWSSYFLLKQRSEGSPLRSFNRHSCKRVGLISL